MEQPIVIVEREVRVGHVRLNRPQALDDALMGARGEALLDLDDDGAIGPIVGGGCELALACDIVVAARSARFGLPEIKFGLLRGAGGTQRLPRAIGKAQAMDMFLSARMLDAEEADRYGLVSLVVGDDKLREETGKLATSVASLSSSALMALTQCVNSAFESVLTEGVLFERRELYARFATHYAHERVKALLEKRKPVFAYR